MASRVFKRGRIYYCWVPKSGGRGVEKRSTHCTDQRAAEKEAGRLERLAVDPSGADKNTRTLEDALGLVVLHAQTEARQGKGSEATVDFYTKKSGALLHALAVVLERDPAAPIFLYEVDSGLVDRYLEGRRASVRDSTVAKELTTWRMAMHAAKRRGWYAGDLDALFPKGFQGASKPRERWLTFADVDALYRALVRPQAFRGGWVAPVDRGHELFAVVAYSIATSAEWSAIWRARREDIAPDLMSVVVRGSKNERREERPVPITLLPFALLLDFARTYGDGSLVLFRDRSANFRRILAEACDRAGIPRCSPNDLRRTHGKWLRLSGVAPQAIAPSMGHADSRMVERVYGKASAEELAHVQRAQIIAGQTGMYLGGDQAISGTFQPSRETGRVSQKASKQGFSSVPRDGIEPPTRGFSIPSGPPQTQRKAVYFGRDWDVFGQPVAKKITVGDLVAAVNQEGTAPEALRAGIARELLMWVDYDRFTVEEQD